MTSYDVDLTDIATYEKEVLPYWNGRTMRDRIFQVVPEEWKRAYSAGMFTEFMEQRAAGHTTLDGIIYEKGMLDFKEEISEVLSKLDYLNDPEAIDKEEELKAMLISCDAAIHFANRHADPCGGNCRNRKGSWKESRTPEDRGSMPLGAGPCPQGPA